MKPFVEFLVVLVSWWCIHSGTETETETGTG